MNNQFGFLAKVLLLSVVLSLFIKYVAPIVPIPESDINALILVLSPTVIMAVLLGVRFRAVRNL
ncbi:hypothetical protein NIES4101_75710 [Calothrix sp. NIES-4101]|nr:hypothetical protein NIES4101_75710 [Calothrix sp. NIES-4101]